MTILEKIKKEIQDLIGKFFSKDTGNVKFDVSFIDEKNSKYGDISTNIAMVLGSSLDKNPKEIGERLVLNINEDIAAGGGFSKIIKNASLSTNGFINIFLTDEAVKAELANIQKTEFVETKFTKKNILVEHSSPNLFKPFHIGHLMNNIIGESVVQMMRATDANVKVMSFPSDISIGIAKAIYILKNKKNWSFFNEDIISKLGQAYAEGVKFYEENPDKQDEIKLVAKNLFEKNEGSEDYQIFKKAKEVNVKYFEDITSELGSHFDKFIYESEAGKRGEQIVKENINLEVGKQVFEMGEGGAVFFDTKKKKNNESEETIKAVFINSEGNPTYEAKDLGLLDLKYAYFYFDYSFFVTDTEQVPHFEVVMQASKEIGENFKDIIEKSKHISHGRLNLKGSERMSSRTGNILTVEDVLKIVNKKVEEKLSDRAGGLNEEEKKNLIKNISLSALRIAILKSKPGLNIEFDLENSLNFEGSTGPYLLYTYARACSIVEKSKSLDLEKLDFEIEANNFTKKIIESEVVYKKAIEDIAPQLIVKYLFELAQSFNTYYAKEKFINEEYLVTTAKNIYLAKIFMKVLKTGLNMIGIKEVERM